MANPTISEKIAQSTLLQAVARVAMALSLPLMGYALTQFSAMGERVAQHSTDIALLQQSASALERRVDATEARTDAMMGVLNELRQDLATTKRDVGYLRDWVEEIKRTSRTTAFSELNP